jgi:hypothetical protein
MWTLIQESEEFAPLVENYDRASFEGDALVATLWNFINSRSDHARHHLTP